MTMHPAVSFASTLCVGIACLTTIVHSSFIAKVDVWTDTQLVRLFQRVVSVCVPTGPPSILFGRNEVCSILAIL